MSAYIYDKICRLFFHKINRIVREIKNSVTIINYLIKLVFSNYIYTNIQYIIQSQKLVDD